MSLESSPQRAWEGTLTEPPGLAAGLAAGLLTAQPAYAGGVQGPRRRFFVRLPDCQLDESLVRVRGGGDYITLWKAICTWYSGIYWQLGDCTTYHLLQETGNFH